jgi:DNA-binding PadR family transcriptional regulator
MKDVERESLGSVRLEIGSLYRLLGRLLEEGLIEDADGDERRRYYRISRLGRRVLKAEAERIAGLADLVRARRLLPEGDA